MEWSTWRALSKCFLMFSLLAHCSSFAVCQEVSAKTNAASEVLKRIDQLVEQNRQLEAQNQELMNQIESLHGVIALRANAAAMASEASPIVRSAVPRDPPAAPPPSANLSVNQEEQKQWGTYTPNQGFKLADTECGDLSLSIYTYVPYLNQLALHPTYTKAFGDVMTVQQRQDVQIQKVQTFLGWILSQNFRYFLYAWTGLIWGWAE
jgi:hypothetical protein